MNVQTEISEVHLEEFSLFNVSVKYLGLLAMSKILKSHPKSVQSHKDLVMQCLDDKDESIRLRALDLLYGMVSYSNDKKIISELDAKENWHYDLIETDCC